MQADLTSNVFDTVLIFEGGGMRASYTCALANVLLENGIFFDNVYGLSAGASNAVNYVSRDIDRTKRSFVDLVKDPEFGGVGTFLQHKGFLQFKKHKFGMNSTYSFRSLANSQTTIPAVTLTFRECLVPN